MITKETIDKIFDASKEFLLLTLLEDLVLPYIFHAKIATSFLEGKAIAQELGFPLVIRPSFTLGGSWPIFVVI